MTELADVAAAQSVEVVLPVFAAVLAAGTEFGLESQLTEVVRSAVESALPSIHLLW
jgi:hypothetical protein